MEAVQLLGWMVGGLFFKYPGGYVCVCRVRRAGWGAAEHRLSPGAHVAPSEIELRSHPFTSHPRSVRWPHVGKFTGKTSEAGTGRTSPEAEAPGPGCVAVSSTSPTAKLHVPKEKPPLAVPSLCAACERSENTELQHPSGPRLIRGDRAAPP